MGNQNLTEKQYLKIILINLSRSHYYRNLLQSYSDINFIAILSEEVPENERITIPIDNLEYELNLFRLLTILNQDKTLNDHNNIQKFNDFISDIQNHRLFKNDSNTISYSFVWTYFLDFLIKQWDFKMRRIILKHFNASDYIDHLTETDKKQIKYLGRASQSLNPHVKLLGKMISFTDDFSNNERECKSFDFCLINLNLSNLRCRFDKSAVSEMILDNFSYHLQRKKRFKSESEHFIRNLTTYSSNIPTSFNQENLINKKLNSSFTLQPLYGYKNQIVNYPISLTFSIDRNLEEYRLDGSLVTIQSEKLLKFSPILTAEDFKDQTFDEDMKFVLIAVQSTKGKFYIRQTLESDEGWLEVHSSKFKKISSEKFKKIFTQQKVEILIYNRNTF